MLRVGTIRAIPRATLAQAIASVRLGVCTAPFRWIAGRKGFVATFIDHFVGVDTTLHAFVSTLVAPGNRQTSRIGDAGQKLAVPRWRGAAAEIVHRAYDLLLEAWIRFARVGCGLLDSFTKLLPLLGNKWIVHV